MPEMDGIELARRAAELDPDIKIMFITGFAAVALNSDSSAPKHAKVLSKPIHLRRIGHRSAETARRLSGQNVHLGLSASHMAQEAVDVALHSAGMVEQPLCGLEHFVRSRESRVGVAVQVDHIFCHRSRTVRG